MSEKLYYNIGKLVDGHIEWASSHGIHYDEGYFPNCSLNDEGLVAEVHQTHRINSDRMYYHIGKLDGGKITWAKKSGTFYDDGRNPSVSIDNANNLVEVHQRQEGRGWLTAMVTEESYNLYYRVATIVDNSIHWNKTHGTHFKYFSANPSVSINNKDQVSIAEAGKRLNRSGKIWFNNGFMSQQARIRQGVLDIQDGGEKLSFSDDNINPQVSVNDLGDVVVVFYQAGTTNLYYRVGKLSEDSLYISWTGEDKKYANGILPSVSINNMRDVVEIHQNGKNISYKTGVLDKGKINWNEASGINFDTGQTPSVSINNKSQVIEVHKAN